MELHFRYVVCHVMPILGDKICKKLLCRPFLYDLLCIYTNSVLLIFCSKILIYFCAQLVAMFMLCLYSTFLYLS
jgi:hypothetical protein